MTVSWEPPLKDKQNGIILHYIVYIGPIKREKSVLSSERETIITDLAAFTVYNMQMAAFTIAGSSNLSDAVRVVTESAGISYSIALFSVFKCLFLCRSFPASICRDCSCHCISITDSDLDAATCFSSQWSDHWL